jgi:colanic acid/amylovoran biosynthesis glycosyltransferase
MKRIAYLMSRFPKITETFILYEIVELERRGMQVEIFPLLREREPVSHPEARTLTERAHFARWASVPVILAQLYWLLRRPLAYLDAWRRALAGNLGSPKFLLRALATVPMAAWFARRMVELGTEHIHAHWATHPTLAAYVAHRLTGLPYSFTAHAHDIYVERPMLAEKLRAADFVVTISEYNRRLLADLYGELAAKVQVIHCGVDSAVFQPRQKAAAGETPLLLCVASLEDYKGHAYLIKACARLRDSGRRFRCLLVGDGELRPAIEARIARLGLQDVVVLLGRQPRERVSELLAEADVLVLPSVTTESGKQEGIPVALMEALACEVPVVATAISGIPELVIDGATGLLVPQRDAAALAGALARLCDNPEFGRRLAANGRALVLQEFDLIENTARLYNLLQQSVPLAEASRDLRPISAHHDVLS